MLVSAVCGGSDRKVTTQASLVSRPRALGLHPQKGGLPALGKPGESCNPPHNRHTKIAQLVYSGPGLLYSPICSFYFSLKCHDGIAL